MKDISSAVTFIKSLNRTINIVDLQALIYEFGIDASFVSFLADFSITTKNSLVTGVGNESQKIVILINISLLPEFSEIYQFYITADKNDQTRLKRIIQQGTSILLHTYFYAKYPHWNKLANRLFSANNYEEDECHLLSPAVIMGSIKNSLSDYDCVITLENHITQSHQRGYSLGENALLGNCTLSGPVSHPQSFIKITIYLDNFNNEKVQKIKHMIKQHCLIDNKPYHLQIFLEIKAKTIGILNTLPLTVGKSHTRPSTYELIA